MSLPPLNPCNLARNVRFPDTYLAPSKPTASLNDVMCALLYFPLRDQRILARRKRVEDKIAAMKRTTDGAEVKEKTAEEVGMGRVQVIESKKKVLRQKKEGDEETEEVKHDNMKREAERRAFEERARQELKERLLVEAEERCGD